jgi:hypothetical protein
MYFHLINLAFYVIFLAFLTINAIKLMDAKCNLKQLNKYNATNSSDNDNDNDWSKIEVMYERDDSIETSKVKFLYF